MVAVGTEEVIVSVGGLSDSRAAKSSGGSSSSLNGCWTWLAENGISVEYCVDIFDGLITPHENRPSVRSKFM